MSAARTRVLVLGGGLVGLSVANYLLAADYDVVLLDRNEPGSGVSYGNAGLVANFAILPTANRSALAALPRQLWRNDASISVRGHYWHRMLAFGRHFMRASRPGTYRQNRAVLADLIRRGCREFLDSADAFGTRDLIAERGVLLVYEGGGAWRQVKHDEVPQRRDLGVASSILDRQEVCALEPALANFPMAGGVLYPDAAHVLDPGSLCRRLLERFLAQGGRFERVSLERIDSVSGGGVRVHSTARTSFVADKAVIALGANAREFLDRSQWRAPLVSERGYHIEVDSPVSAPTRPIGWGDRHFFLTPMTDSLRVAGTTEFAHPDTPADTNRYRLLQRWTERLLGQSVHVRSHWVGSRATTPDGLPVIGLLPDCPDIVLATGHGHVGLTLSALTGRMVVDVLQARDDACTAAPLSPARFASAA